VQLPAPTVVKPSERTVKPKPERRPPAVKTQESQPQPERKLQAATVAAPGVGQLYITSNVAGARITVDGRTSPEWVTPYVFTGVPLGSHEVVVSRSGYANASGRVQVEDGRVAPFSAQLTPEGGGEINIVTNPPGFEVSIDGGAFAASPVRAVVSAGPHTYRIKLPSSRVYEGTFDMQNGGIITRRVDFAGGEWLTPTPTH
jgi:hypothetical protein